MKYILLAAVLYFVPANAETYSIHSSNGDMVRLYEEPCDTAIGWLAKPLHKAFMRYKGKDYKACWFSVGTTVLIVDEAGDSSAVPMNLFKLDLGI